VKNCEDGSVELMAQGITTAIEELITRLWKGSYLSRVKEVEVLEHVGDEGCNSFEVKV